MASAWRLFVDESALPEPSPVPAIPRVLATFVWPLRSSVAPELTFDVCVVPRTMVVLLLASTASLPKCSVPAEAPMPPAKVMVPPLAATVLSEPPVIDASRVETVVTLAVVELLTMYRRAPLMPVPFATTGSGSVSEYPWRSMAPPELMRRFPPRPPNGLARKLVLPLSWPSIIVPAFMVVPPVKVLPRCWRSKCRRPSSSATLNR